LRLPPFHPDVESDMRESVRFYDGRSRALGDDFTIEVHRTMMRAAENPAHGSPYVAGCRRMRVPTFGKHWVVYLEDGGSVIIVAVAHSRRPPGFWSDRMGDLGAA
jgi:plasmid stabilization system protein ParE